MKDGVYYSDYLQLDKILNAQTLESDREGRPHAHDEMLFIIIHQSYELWFKQVLYEVNSVMEIMAQPSIIDNSPDMYVVHHRLKRVNTIMHTLIGKVDILETMTALDFLDFRNMLRPASGFQSMQFKILEASLGLRMQQRHGKEYYTSQLRPEDKQKIEELENRKPLITLINEWLERLPFFEHASFWEEPVNEQGEHPFWLQYANLYAASLQPAEQFNFERFKELMLANETDGQRSLTPKARRAALFIMLYRDYPLLQMPFKIIDALLELDECLATWRYRHMNMVHRMIGTRTGTGGSTGKDYLKGALDKHYIFSEFAELTSFLIERRKLPKLSEPLRQRLSFEE